MNTEEHWHKDIHVGDRVSYADVCFWFSKRGTLEKLEGYRAFVRWDKYPVRAVEEWAPNLIAWRKP